MALDNLPSRPEEEKPRHEASLPETSAAGEPAPRHERTGEVATGSWQVRAAGAPVPPAGLTAQRQQPVAPQQPTVPQQPVVPQQPAPRPTAPQPGAAAPQPRPVAPQATAPQPARPANPNVRHTMEVPQPTAPAPKTAGAVPPRGPQAPVASVNSQAAPAPRPKKAPNPVVLGMLGGFLGALLVGGLWFAFTGVSRSVNVPTTPSAAGPTVDITAAGNDVKLPEAVAAKCLPSVASLTVSGSAGEGVGSGVVFDKDGNILTNYHVVEGAQTIDVSLNGKSYEGTLVGDDPSSDLAVVHIDLEGDSVTPMAIGDSSKLVVGQWVMSLGSPFGLDQSVSTGIVSSLYRSTILQGTSGNTIYTNLVQTDAAINPGNSGGALVNANGELIGINSTIMSASGSSSGVGFAIPSNYAADVARTIIAGKEVEHAFLGANVATVTAQSAVRNHFPVNQGAYIASVTKDGPAAQAGLQEGDIVTQLGDEAITSADGLILAVRSHNVGDKVELTYYRGNKEHTVEVTLGSDASGKEPERQQSSFDLNSLTQ